MIREAGHTRRCHGTKIIGEQTVAEHSFHVAMLCIEICQGKASAELLKAALYHDLPECETGDVPAPVKWKSPAVAGALEEMEQEFNERHNLHVSITAEELIILKWADSLELAFFCVDQLMMGNRFVKHMYNSIMHYTTKLPRLPTVAPILERLQEKYEEATF